MNAMALYERLREREGRIYSDEIVARLPYIPKDHPLSDEWQARADSSKRLAKYISRVASPLTILEVGCGNGWLSHQVARIPNSYVYGLDRVGIELTQAARLFNSSNLILMSADVFQLPFTAKKFDVIILASVIQYFPDLPALIRALQPYLSQRGEIHIMDSALYSQKDLSAARERSLNYYAQLGFPQMAEHYFCHAVDSLKRFSPRWLYRPSRLDLSLWKHLGKVQAPFPWICIR
jgi:ubiquinone/menaquinone biosynthesis C-methylase UbiE